MGALIIILFIISLQLPCLAVNSSLLFVPSSFILLTIKGDVYMGRIFLSPLRAF